MVSFVKIARSFVEKKKEKIFSSSIGIVKRQTGRDMMSGKTIECDFPTAYVSEETPLSNDSSLITIHFMELI